MLVKVTPVELMACTSRFAAPFSDDHEQEHRLSRIPDKTKKATLWGIRVWTDWASARSNDCSCPSSSTDFSSDRALVTNNILEMAVRDIAYWMGKFVLEVRKKDGSEYPPKTLYGLVCCFNKYLRHWLLFLPHQRPLEKRTLNLKKMTMTTILFL